MAARKFGTKNREGREKGKSKLMSENMAKEKWTTGNLVLKNGTVGRRATER